MGFRRSDTEGPNDGILHLRTRDVEINRGCVLIMMALLRRADLKAKNGVPVTGSSFTMN